VGASGGIEEAQLRAVLDKQDETGAAMMRMDRATFLYQPYPIGLIKGVFEPSFYDRLVQTFPVVDLFRFMQYHGDKWSLSEVNNRDRYFAFLSATPEWKRVYDYVKSAGFVRDVLAMLLRHKIDLGLPPAPEAACSAPGLRARLRALLGGTEEPGLGARFEFSMMSAAGGHILPHTDSPQKVITLVMSMLGPGEWDQEWGGGTDLMRPKDPSDNFNFHNRYLGFDQVETIDSMAYEPNQCVIFIKTFNSLHAVRPMRGPSGVMRRTLTVNIESRAPNLVL
jgi:hypothetical protein